MKNQLKDRKKEVRCVDAEFAQLFPAKFHVLSTMTVTMKNKIIPLTMKMKSYNKTLTLEQQKTKNLGVGKLNE